VVPQLLRANSSHYTYRIPGLSKRLNLEVHVEVMGEPVLLSPFVVGVGSEEPVDFERSSVEMIVIAVPLAVFFVVPVLSTIFVVIYMRHQVVRLTGASFLLFFFAGMMFIDMCVAVKNIYPPTSSQCWLGSAFGHLGYALMVCSLLSKVLPNSHNVIRSNGVVDFTYPTFHHFFFRFFQPAFILIIFLICRLAIDPPDASIVVVGNTNYVVCKASDGWSILFYAVQG
jgi:hypothetical protein